jgi:predicted LPLAT superfamily acyltransferase
MSQSDQRNNSSHWARLEERGVYVGLRIMLWTYRVLGRRGFSLLMYPVIGYFFIFDSEARRSSRAFLTRVHATPLGRKTFIDKPGLRQSYHHFLSFGEAILDKLWAWAGGIGEDDIIYENREIFDELQLSGRGGLLIASHLGNMEVCRALGQLSLGLKLNVLVHTKHAPNFNRLLNQVGPASSVSLIQTTEVSPATAMMLHNRIAQGEFVVIVGDRTPVNQSPRQGWAPFFGQPAPFPQGPFILASILECPVQLIFCIKRAGQHHIIFENFSNLINIPRRNRTKILDECVATYATRLEYYCSKDPLQWFNFFDFWGLDRTTGKNSNPIE